MTCCLVSFFVDSSFLAFFEMTSLYALCPCVFLKRCLPIFYCLCLLLSSPHSVHNTLFISAVCAKNGIRIVRSPCDVCKSKWRRKTGRTWILFNWTYVRDNRPVWVFSHTNSHAHRPAGFSFSRPDLSRYTSEKERMGKKLDMCLQLSCLSFSISLKVFWVLL